MLLCVYVVDKSQLENKNNNIPYMHSPLGKWFLHFSEVGPVMNNWEVTVY